MKTVLLFIFLFFACNQLQGQSLYPILLESYKHVNVYNYNNKTNMKEEIDVSIKLRKITKNECKIISDALMTSGFEFNSVNDTILIVTSHSDMTPWAPPSKLLARSSKSVKLLTESYSDSGKYEENMRLIEPNPHQPPIGYYYTNAYAFMVFQISNDPYVYAENYFKMVYPEYPAMYKEFYLKDNSGEYPLNYYAMMYYGDVDAFRELYINKIGKVLGEYYSVFRIVINDGKIVYPTLLWYY